MNLILLKEFPQFVFFHSAAVITGRVKLPITQHVPIIKHFSIFSSFLNQIELLLCYWMHKLEGCKCSLKDRSKGAMQKVEEEYE
jgi:hypothetical protein